MTTGIWQLDGSGVHTDNADHSERQVTWAHSIRYRHVGGPRTVTYHDDPRQSPACRGTEALYSLLTVTCYGVAGSPGPYQLELQREFMVCTDPNDPGDTERWADGRHEEIEAFFTSPAEADQAARSHLQNMLTQTESPVSDWDGLAPWEAHPWRPSRKAAPRS